MNDRATTGFAPGRLVPVADGVEPLVVPPLVRLLRARVAVVEVEIDRQPAAVEEPSQAVPDAAARTAVVAVRLGPFAPVQRLNPLERYDPARPATQLHPVGAVVGGGQVRR